MTRTAQISLEEKAIVAVLRAAGVIRRKVLKLLEGYGLTPSQYNVLRILRGAPDGLATMEIAARLIDEEPGITRLIDALERGGFLERTRSAEDRRRIDCHVTERGRKLLSDLDGPIEDLDRQLLEGVSAEETMELARLASRIVQE